MCIAYTTRITCSGQRTNITGQTAAITIPLQFIYVFENDFVSIALIEHRSHVVVDVLLLLFDGRHIFNGLNYITNPLFSPMNLFSTSKYQIPVSK